MKSQSLRHNSIYNLCKLNFNRFCPTEMLQTRSEECQKINKCHAYSNLYVATGKSTFFWKPASSYWKAV